MQLLHLPLQMWLISYLQKFIAFDKATPSALLILI